MRLARGCNAAEPSLKRAAMPVVAGDEPAAAAARPRAARARKPRRLRTTSPVRDRVEYLAVRAVFGLLGALPLALSLRVAEAVMGIVYALAVPFRRVGLTNLAIAFPERPSAERARILRASMANLGRM